MMRVQFTANRPASNARLQRTRSAPLRSPLSRRPLGGWKRHNSLSIRVVLLLLSAPCALAGQGVVARGVVRGADKVLNHVSVRQVSGDIVKEGCTGGDVFAGVFVIEVRRDKGKSVTTPLNDLMGGGALRFPVDRWHGAWSIVFTDYNHDGQPDFALTGLSCQNNASYYLFTILTSGTVKPLRLSTGPAILAQGDTVSTRFRTTPDGFRTAAYNNSIGEYELYTYRWDSRHAVFTLVDHATSNLSATPTPAP